ncbi:MAG: hypothetical protein A2X25_00975 [Chloroflexi bacterium GWB2_49_20]|nr:MAG: hypothetical protein A2X25_00975 [Chloroflexi bacterium GWB2_49_20]OGN78710.1 MAG: hypothetical protein A2X26_07905 [Chloroflexi bacterium GWC2_49_37]OGN85351.1 MAG: hypothetical protein A2X27_03440 [Chloroflexi bacterium GWD2_49_16]
MTDQELAYVEIEKLVRNFKKIPAAQRKGMNEMQTRLGYILPLFSALGWNTSNMNEVSPEEKVSRGWVDFSFRIGGVPRFFLETKRVDEDLNDPRWVKQAIDYAWTKSVTWALLSDFEGLRVFNAEWQESNPFRAQFFEFTTDTYLSDFERLWWLSREQTAIGRLDKEGEKFGRSRKRLPVTQELFSDLKRWREILFKDLQAYNPILSAGDIDNAVLRLLNRLIFIRTAEDRQVESPRLRALVRELKDKGQIRTLSAGLSNLFREMDGIYNSELFAKHFSEGLDITPATLEEVIEGLYEKNFVRYNFNALDADVLGTVYEQYLGSVVADKSEEENKPKKGAQQDELFSGGMTVQERRTKRKSQGIYYTPAFVTKYIVQQTVGKYLEENGYNPSRPPRVLDMACGSGSFLIEAFDVIDNFVAKLRGQARIGEVDFNDRLRQMEVLQSCIFGVDKDKQAVEVARLNLLLRGLHSREKLPMLENIANGDSLHDETFTKFFPQVIQDEGFDIVIGNPPYVRIQTLDKSEVEYFKQNYLTATGSYDIYVLFVEQALRLLKPGGMMGYILPNKFMQVDYGLELRKLLSENKYVKKIVDFKESQVFEGATTYTCLLFLKKQDNPSFEVLRVNIGEEKPTAETFTVPEINKAATSLTEKAWLLSNNSTKSIFDKLSNSKTVSLLDLPSHISRGSSSGADDIYILGRIDDNHFKTGDGKSVEIEPEVMRIPLYATDFGRYLFRPKSQERIIFPYVVGSEGYTLIAENEFKESYPRAYQYLVSQRERLEKRKDYRTWYAFSAPRNLNVHVTSQVVVPLLADKGLYAKLPKDTSNFCLMASGGFSISFGDENLSPEYLLGLLNSSLLFWYLHQVSNVFRGGWITCTKQYVGQLPIRRINFENLAEKYAHDEIVKLVEKMLELQKERQAIRPGYEFDHARDLDHEIKRVDEEIDRRVYALYGLTEEEIKIVEE